MKFSNSFLDQKRHQTDPIAEQFVRQAISVDQHAFWKFISDLEGNTIPSAFLSLVEKYFPGYDQLPKDFDTQIVSESEFFFERYAQPIFILLGTYSLPYCYAAEAGVQVLFQTQRLTKRPLKRLQETGLFVFNVSEGGAFSDQGNGWLSILKVRLMHAAVRVKIDQHTDWNVEKWGKPINQEDMAGTLISFSLIVLMGLRKLGYTITEREAEVYFQRWQMIGAKLGLQKEMLPSTRAQAFRLAKCIEKRHMRPSQAGQALNQVLIKESEKSAQGQLPKGYISALMRYLLGEKVAHCVGLNESSWADPVVQLLFIRQKYFAAPPTTSPEKLHAEYLEVKTQLLQVA